MSISFEFILYYMVFCLNLRYLKVQILLHTQILIILFWYLKKIYWLAPKTILSESRSIKLTDFLDENFIEATQNIYNSKGRLIVTGIGKVLLLLKMVATFNSTGTPSLFLHASEAIHDLGMIQNDDSIICISKARTVQKLKFWYHF
jgi:arabinose-5-phosphate isomerase